MKTKIAGSVMTRIFPDTLKQLRRYRAVCVRNARNGETERRLLETYLHASNSVLLACVVVDAIAAAQRRADGLKGKSRPR